MRAGFDAPWWTLDQVSLWMALRAPYLVDDAHFEAPSIWALLLPQAPSGEEAEIFAAAADDLLPLDVPLAETKLLAEVIDALGDAHLTLLNSDWQARLVGIAGSLTLRTVLDFLTSLLEDGSIASRGRVADAHTQRDLRPQEWPSMRIDLDRDDSLSVRSESGAVVHKVNCRRVDVLAMFPDLQNAADDAPKIARGRSKGSRQYDDSDLALVRKMHSYAESNRVSGLYSLAARFAHEAAGDTTTHEAKCKRLVRRFKAEYPDHPLVRRNR